MVRHTGTRVHRHNHTDTHLYTHTQGRSSPALAVQQQVDDEGLPGFLLAQRIQGGGNQGEAEGHDLQRLAAHLLVLAVRLVPRVGLHGTTERAVKGKPATVLSYASVATRFYCGSNTYPSFFISFK